MDAGQLQPPRWGKGVTVFQCGLKCHYGLWPVVVNCFPFPNRALSDCTAFPALFPIATTSTLNVGDYKPLTKCTLPLASMSLLHVFIQFVHAHSLLYVLVSILSIFSSKLLEGEKPTLFNLLCIEYVTLP